MPPARLGVVYSHTGLRRFVDAIGAARTRELFLTARPVDAAEALAWGLVNEVVEDVQPRSAGARSRRCRRCRCAGTSGSCSALIPPLRPALEAELHALRDARLPLRGLRRGRARLYQRNAPPRWHGR